MRQALSFLAIVAMGLILAGMMSVVGTAPGYRAGTDYASKGFALDFGSLILGIAIGVSLTALGRVSWLELPRKLVHWLITHERVLLRAGMAGAFILVLLFY